ncbi:MAG: nucleoside triphosphate pyrophosphohydrolase [Candidatus Competibacteraceae bacterium]|nr:nucleoside triphosphate pyrophosphohydrolase [Candidatus Competibacteraceae bacterium]
MQPIEQLLELMARLRDPQSGCPWDRQQTYATIVPHTLEEAYEVADAIARHDLQELKDELGDLLFQVVFYAQIAREEGVFDFDAVARSITEKMIRRHPHVFGEASYTSVQEQSEAWERIKATERGRKPDSILAGVSRGLPALTRAVKLQLKAARVGFDWSQTEPVMAKIREELQEIEAEIQTRAPAQRLADEVGDLLFACANLARHLGCDPETALSGTNGKFERRFRRIETWLAEQGRSPDQATLAELDALWDRAKGEERTPSKSPPCPRGRL